MKRSCFHLLLALFCSGWLSAQESVVASGGTASGAGGSATYSVGQVVYTQIDGSSGSALQGVQQPYEISVLDIEEHPTIKLYAIVYPNPTQDNIILKITSAGNGKFQYELFDVRGRLLLNNITTGEETTIPLENFPSGNYILMVRSGQSLLKSFKIIKK